MPGIPPAVDSDVEDVVWALQTADALWKRNERGDALVWLRRAAQAAGEANQDSRALVLARDAAELTEWIAQASAARYKSAPPGTAAASGDIDDLLRVSHTDVETSTSPPPVVQAPPRPPSPPPEPPRSPVPPPLDYPPPAPPEAEPPTPAPPLAAPSPSPAPVSAAPISAVPISAVPISAVAEDGTRVASVSTSQPPSQRRVLTAAESHAGMLDPWAEAESKKPPRPPPPKRPASGKPSFEDDEVITSAKPIGPRSPSPPPAAPAAPPRPQPLSAARPAKPLAPAPAPAHPPPPALFSPEPHTRPRPAPPPTPSGPPDLSPVEAFADLPDDARATFALAAAMRGLARGQEVTGFALALVVEGSFDVRAVGAEGVATKVSTGAVLRARGTLDGTIPIALVCASDTAILATWDDAHVEAAFGTCPWVEDDLRAAGDRVQALAGLSQGSLGRPSYTEVLANVDTRFTMRALAEGETLLDQAEPVSGLMIVGAGLVELAKDDKVLSSVKPGGFVFASQALAAGRAPERARAGAGGALVMLADRATTQELVVTQPLLLELLAGT